MSFRPSPGLSLALLVLCLVFARLGWWQLDRGAAKQRLFDEFAQAPMMTIEQALQKPDGFSRVEAWGRYDPRRHILLDNKIFRGRAGVHVLTPFYLESGPVLLVNRGWLPLQPDRRRLPEIETPLEKRLISGLLRQPATGGPRLGGADRLASDRWPQLVTYFDWDDIGAALAEPLPQRVLQLDPDDPSGFEDREWQAAVMTPATHRAYAWQWFSLAVASIIIWIALGFRRGKHKHGLKTTE
jgi:surfeit locus 1 family protein